MAERATADSWDTRPMPELKASLPLQRHLSAEAYRSLTCGLTPSSMDDRWFAYWADDVLHVYRSWTGYAIYRVHFKPVDNGYEVAQVWVNRDPEQYGGSDELDLVFLEGLIDQLARPGRLDQAG